MATLQWNNGVFSLQLSNCSFLFSGHLEVPIWVKLWPSYSQNKGFQPLSDLLFSNISLTHWLSLPKGRFVWFFYLEFLYLRVFGHLNIIIQSDMATYAGLNNPPLHQGCFVFVSRNIFSSREIVNIYHGSSNFIISRDRVQVQCKYKYFYKYFSKSWVQVLFPWVCLSPIQI